MRRCLLHAIVSTILIFFAVNGYAWDCHFLLTYVAVSKMPQISHKALIPAESLDSFLQKEKRGLVKLLQKNEAWSEKNIQVYPALPANLIFTGNRKSALKTQFLEAIRVNPEMPIPLFLQLPPNASQKMHQHPLPLSSVLLPAVLQSKTTEFSSLPFEAISPNQKISPLEILASASDEPDYGMDVNLWENSGTWYGKLYHWGQEPFGRSPLPITSQGPFHIGFYYESPLVYKIDPFLKECFPEYRIHLYIELSRFAFKTGHPYWGYRFLGWAVHYLQDLTQPYHTTLAPNISTARLLSASALDYMGIHGPENTIIQLVTNRHFALENYQFNLLKSRLKIDNPTDPILESLSDIMGDSHYPAYNNVYPRDVVAKESHSKADQIGAAILAFFPKKYVDEANYVFFVANPNSNLFATMKQYPTRNMKVFNATVDQLFRPIGAHTRKLVRYATRTAPDKKV